MLTKNESQISKMAKEGMRQLKFINNLMAVFDLKYKILMSTSLVLPLIAHPFEFNGLTFQLVIEKRRRKNEYDSILIAYGGRYDKLINSLCICAKDFYKQFAVGLSIDFDRLVYLINEKSTANKTFRQELAVVLRTDLDVQKQQASNDEQQTNTEIYKESLYLYKFLSNYFKSMPIACHLIHEKLSKIEDIEAYCKKFSINSIAFLNRESQPSDDKQIFFKIRTIFNDKNKNNEKKLCLNDLQATLITNRAQSTGSIDSYLETLINSHPQTQNQQSQQPQQQLQQQSQVITNSFSHQVSIVILSDQSFQTQSAINLSLASTSSNNSPINVTRKKTEAHILQRIQSTLQLFSTKARIELIAIDLQELIVHTLANNLRLDLDEQIFSSSWLACMDKLNFKLRKQLVVYKLDELLYDLRFVKRSKVFVFYSLKTEAFRVIVAP